MDVNFDGNTLSRVESLSVGEILTPGPNESYYLRFTSAGGDCGFTANVDKANGDAIDDPTVGAFKLTGGVQGSAPNMTLQVQPANPDWSAYQVSWISWLTTGHFGVGLGSDDGVNQLQVFGSTSLDSGAITTDGNGYATVVGLFASDQLQVNGPSYLDGGNIMTDGSGFLTVGGRLFVNNDITAASLAVYGDASFSNGAVSTDGSGTLTVQNLTVNNTISLDGGSITTDGSGDLTAARFLVPFDGSYVRLEGQEGQSGFSVNVDKSNGDSIDNPSLGAAKFSVDLTYNNVSLQVAPAGVGWSAATAWMAYLDTGHLGVGGGSDDGVNQLQVFGSTALDSGSITTDGSGGASFGGYLNCANGIGNTATSNTWQINDDGSAAFSVMKPKTISAPSSPSAGWMYFDGTNLKVYSGGAWKTVQLV